MFRELKHVWGILGLLAAVPSTISLIQRTFDLELVVTLAGFLDFYRGLIGPIFDILYPPLAWLLARFDLSVPPWLPDAQTLATAGAAIQLRAVNSVRENGEERYPSFFSRLLIVATGGLTLLGLLSFALVALCMLVFPMHLFQALRAGVRPRHVFRAVFVGSDAITARMHVTAILGWITMFVVVLFFLVNAGMA